ncbi:MAG: DUF819 family protein, partial [Bacteroidota bacterium]
LGITKSSIMSLIAPNDHFYILAFLFIAVAVGIYGEYRGWFVTISGVLVTIILGVIFTSLGILPDGSRRDISVPVYDFAFTYLIPFSIPLLLFNIELKRVFRESGSLMLIFLLGSLGVVLGTVSAALLFDLGPETYKLAGVYTATYTGGSVNFMAVAQSFSFLESDLFKASIVVDNVFTIIYILIIFYLPKMNWLRGYFPAARRAAPTKLKAAPIISSDDLLMQLGLSMVISAVLVALGMLISPILESWLKTDVKLSALLITIFILFLANIFPQAFRPLEALAFQVGMFFLYFFLAVIGATCNLYSLITASPLVLAFAVTTLLIHLGFVLLLGRLFRFSLEEIAIASGANVGGVSISAPMAATFGMKASLTPAILIGIMGYVLGTFLGIGVGVLLR